MNKKVELNKLVVATLGKTPWNPTARQLFREVRDESPNLVRKGFRSFVKIINQYENVCSAGGKDVMVYKVCKK